MLAASNRVNRHCPFHRIGSKRVRPAQLRPARRLRHGSVPLPRIGPRRGHRPTLGAVALRIDAKKQISSGRLRRVTFADGATLQRDAARPRAQPWRPAPGGRMLFGGAPRCTRAAAHRGHRRAFGPLVPAQALAALAGRGSGCFSCSPASRSISAGRQAATSPHHEFTAREVRPPTILPALPDLSRGRAGRRDCCRACLGQALDTECAAGLRGWRHAGACMASQVRSARRGEHRPRAIRRRRLEPRARSAALRHVRVARPAPARHRRGPRRRLGFRNHARVAARQPASHNARCPSVSSFPTATRASSRACSTRSFRLDAFEWLLGVLAAEAYFGRVQPAPAWTRSPCAAVRGSHRDRRAAVPATRSVRAEPQRPRRSCVSDVHPRPVCLVSPTAVVLLAAIHREQRKISEHRSGRPVMLRALGVGRALLLHSRTCCIKPTLELGGPHAARQAGIGGMLRRRSVNGSLTLAEPRGCSTSAIEKYFMDGRADRWVTTRTSSSRRSLGAEPPTAS